MTNLTNSFTQSARLKVDQKKLSKVALIEVKPTKNEYIAKEMAGGLGKRIRLGDNFFTPLLSKHLNSLFNAPPIVLAQLSGVCQKFAGEITSYHTSKINDVDSDTQIAIVLSSMVDYKNEVNFIKHLKEKYDEIKVVVVGSFASAMPEIYANVADCVIKDDPEIAMNDILKNGFPNERIVQSRRPEDLNELPMVDWTPFIKNGYYAKRPFTKELGVSIQKSRGCSMTCNYCPYAAFYGKAQQFDSDYVLKTIKYYYDHHRIRYFMFRDPNFGENRKDFRLFMQKLISSHFDITWSCEARLDTFKDEDLVLMAKAGLRYLITGVESSDEELLKANLRRAYKKEDAFRRIDILQDHDVIVQTNYIFGFPHETEDSVLQTIEYAKKLNSMFATFHIFTPQPATKIFESYFDKLMDIDWENFSYSNLVWKHDTLTKEWLENTTSHAYVEYYFRPKWFFKHAWRLAKIVM